MVFLQLQFETREGGHVACALRTKVHTVIPAFEHRKEKLIN